MGVCSLVTLACGGENSQPGMTPPPPPVAPPPDVTPLPGQIVVNPDRPTWLAYYGEGPAFVCGPGEPEDFLFRGELLSDGTRAGDQEALIQKLALTGANSTYLMAVRSHGGDGDSTHNPFTDHDPAKGLDADVLDQWENWFTAMEEHDIVVFFFIYDDGALVWDTGDQVGTEERAFVHTLVDRFEDHRNLVWVIQEEYQKALSPERVRALAREVQLADDHGHPIAVHQLPGLQFDFASDPAIRHFAIQVRGREEGVPDELYGVDPAGLHDAMVRAWEMADGRYSLNASEVGGHGRGTEARRKNWGAALGGAYVMNFDWNIENTSLTDLRQCGYMVRFMESTPLLEMAPRDDLAAGSTRWVLADPPNAYVAYTDDADGPMGVRELEAGLYDLTWLDTVTGVTIEERNRPVPAGQELWPPPASLGTELALFIRETVP